MGLSIYDYSYYRLSDRYLKSGRWDETLRANARSYQSGRMVGLALALALGLREACAVSWAERRCFALADYDGLRKAGCCLELSIHAYTCSCMPQVRLSRFGGDPPWGFVVKRPRRGEA